MILRKYTQPAKYRRRFRGQTTVEYAVLLTVVAMALVTLFTYIRSAISHRMKTGADGVGRGMLWQETSTLQNPLP